MAQAEVSGIFQYLKYGTGASADTATGIIDGGDMNINPDTRRRVGIGGTEVRRGGLLVPGGSASMYVTGTNQALNALALRATYPRGALTELEFEGGADEWEIKYHDCVITDASWDYAQGEGFKSTLSWGSKDLPDEGTTGGTQDAEGALTFEDYEFVITFEGVEYGVSAASLALTNNVTFKGAADTKVATEKRLPTHYIYGIEELTLGITTDIPMPSATVGLYDDVMPEDLDVVLIGSNGTNTLTLTLSDLIAADPLTFGFVDSNSPVAWSYGFMGTAATGSLTWGWA